MSSMRSTAPRRAIVPALRPSEYTAALIQVLQAEPGRVSGAKALEIGSGSGVVLATLGMLRAAALCGVDIEPEAIVAGTRLLEVMGLGAIAEFHRGDMWLPVAGRRFDLIVANLPHFPMAPSQIGDRLPTWSSGGDDGRWLLDPFIEGLSAHLAPGGRAVLTHNGFVGLDRSREIACAHGLSLAVLSTVLVHIPPDKFERMTPAVCAAEEGRSILRYGPYTFGQMHIVEIGAAA